MTIPAILLVGPTGSGKTPFGDYLQYYGLQNRKCFHFDFGHNLRLLATLPTPPPLFSDEDLAFVRTMLEQGALLEDDRFYIAENLLRTFIEDQNISGTDVIILNGLPRHTGQAKQIEPILNIRSVFRFTCTAPVVYTRISGNTGGDRSGRSDDALDKIKNKLKIYTERTEPLVGHYSAVGTPVATLPVDVSTTPAELYALLPEVRL